MLSAVESSHLGAPRTYTGHHPYGNPSLLPSCPIPTYPSLASNSVPAAMSTAEFVKPHPKSRYSSISTGRSGISTGSAVQRLSKYNNGDQPVNLAMSPTTASMEKLKSDYDLLKSGGMPVNFSDFIYPRHSDLIHQNYQPLNYSASAAAVAAAAAAGTTIYSDVVARKSGPSTSSSNSNTGGNKSMLALGRHVNGDSLSYHYSHQRSPNSSIYSSHHEMHAGKHSSNPPPSDLSSATGTGNPSSAGPVLISPDVMHHRLQNYHLQQQLHLQQQQQQQQQQHSKKTSSNPFIIPPPIMPPSSSEMDYVYPQLVDSNSRLYYSNNHEHLIQQQQHQQRLHHHHQQQQQQSHLVNCPPPQLPSQSNDFATKSAMINSHQTSAAVEAATHRDKQQRSQSQTQSSPNNMGFKVPSGKEGSLKHRILTTNRSSSGGVDEKESKRKSPNSRNNSTLQSSNKSNFSKGVLIKLGNGELKRVEDMRTEDFIQSSNTTPGLELIDSTVLKIVPHEGNVIVSLSNPKTKIRVDLTVGMEHPFFVYSQGWASCNPDGTYHLHGLKCQRLKVGDVCISLRQKERNDTIVENMKAVRLNSGSSSSSSSSLSSPPLPQRIAPVQQQPQNLSRKSSATKENDRGLIEGATYHPSLKQAQQSSVNPTTGHGKEKSFPHRDSYTDGNHFLPNNQIVDTILSRLTYLAAFEQAAANSNASATSGRRTPPPQQQQQQQQFSGITHSIKSIVMGDECKKLGNFNGASHGKRTDFGGGNSRTMAPDDAEGNGFANATTTMVSSSLSSSSSISSNCSSSSTSSSAKRRWSAPDNIYEDEIQDVGRDEPPHKIPSH